MSSVKHKYSKASDGDSESNDIELSTLPKTPSENDMDVDVVSLVDHSEFHLTVSPTAHQPPSPGTATNTQVAFNIIISFVGAGLLGLPYAFSRAGWILSCIALTATSAANYYAMLLLVKVREKLERVDGHKGIDGYGDVGRIVMGDRGEVIVNICLVVSQAGFATAYIIFISANLMSIWPVLNSAIICLGCMPILVILVQAREMRTLSPFSLLADFANLAGLSAVLLQDFENYNPHHEDEIRTVDFSNLPYIIGITIYSLEGVGLVLPLESSCQDRSAFPGLLKAVLVGITIVMATFGTAGYLAFGDHALAPITLNLGGSGFSTFVKLALCLALYFTYPIMMFPVHSVLEALYTRSEPTRSFLLRTGLVALSALVAYAIPDFGKFLSLVGSSICMLLGFIFPCFFHLSVFGVGGLPWWQSLLDIMLIVGGIIFGVIGTFHAIINLIQGNDMGEV
jgi:proton-coupled amino acid transporter